MLLGKRIIPAFQFLLTCTLVLASPTSWALSLGNIEVQSHLGEPLRATIKLMEVPKALNAGCFRVMHSADNYSATALSANILLREDETGSASLSIKSYQALESPIVYLTLITDCENQIAREYVLLLDPPSLYEPNIEEALPAASVVGIQAPPNNGPNQIKSQDGQSSKQTTNPTQPQTIPVESVISRKKPVIKNRKENRHISSSNPEPAPAPEAPVKTDLNKPRLVVSGAEYIRPEFFDSPLQLQMSLGLNDWPANEIQALSPDEISDEVTAMTNKMAYLESQMTALQKRNLELENMRTQAAMQRIDEAESSHWMSLLLYALITLLVIVLIGIAEWLRRRNSQHQLAAEVAIWEELAPTAKLQDIGLQEQPDFEAESSSNYVRKFSDIPNPMSRQPVFQSANDDEGMGATVNEDILEQAEVFVAHGRANLAVVLLQDHLREFPSISPAPWLMLLDLLKRDNQSAEYKAATQDCQRHFNVAIEDYDDPLLEDDSSIEDFPRIKEQLEQVWGTMDTLPFLDDLIFNRRLEARQGFERNAYLEFMLLRSIAHDLNFTSTKKKVPVAPYKTRETGIESEKMILQEAPKDMAPNVSNLETANPDVDPMVFEPVNLPKDKSEPLDFAIEFKTKL